MSTIILKSGAGKDQIAQPGIVWSTCYAQRVLHVVENGKHTFYRNDGERVMIQSNDRYDMTDEWVPAPPGSEAPIRTDPLVVSQAVCLYLLRQSWWKPIRGWDIWALGFLKTGQTTSEAAEAAADAGVRIASQAGKAATWVAWGAAEAAGGVGAKWNVGGAVALAEAAEVTRMTYHQAHQDIAACVSEVESWKDNPKARENEFLKMNETCHCAKKGCASLAKAVDHPLEESPEIISNCEKN